MDARTIVAGPAVILTSLLVSLYQYNYFDQEPALLSEDILPDLPDVAPIVPPTPPPPAFVPTPSTALPPSPQKPPPENTSSWFWDYSNENKETEEARLERERTKRKKRLKVIFSVVFLEVITLLFYITRS